MPTVLLVRAEPGQEETVSLAVLGGGGGGLLTTQLLHLLVTGGADLSGLRETRGQRNIVNATTGEQPANPGQRDSTRHVTHQ